MEINQVSFMKKIAKKILPIYLIRVLKNTFLFFHRNKIKQNFRRMYNYDLLRYMKFSRTFGNNSAVKMIGAITVQYHVIEKGLTMPETRLGFGQERIIGLCKSCMEYISRYGQDDEQLNHALGVILEYNEYHDKKSFILDNEVIETIKQLRNLGNEEFEKTSQNRISKNEYFKNVKSSFFEFSNSRSSVRDYSTEDLPMVKIQDSLELARNTPSACNRQAWRTYVYDDKKLITKILEEQGGNRGFGHLANKLIVITGELGVFSSTNERNQVFIDGGMYAMNLLYALQYNEIAACILNCSFDNKKEQKLKQMCGVKESEVLIAMVTCGIAPDEFKIAISLRYPIEKTNTFIKH